MKNIVVCIGNGLLSEAIIKMLQNSGEFKPFRVLIQKKSNIANDCEALSADILFLDVSYASGTTMETRLKEVKQVREKIPTCKLVLLCDENSAPDIARADRRFLLFICNRKIFNGSARFPLTRKTNGCPNGFIKRRWYILTRYLY